jgi:hypothetical protein
MQHLCRQLPSIRPQDFASLIDFIETIFGGSLTKKEVVVKRFVRSLKGGSTPLLVEASDNNLYIVKLTANPQGPNVPFNEFLGGKLLQKCNLAIPPFRTLHVSKASSTIAPSVGLANSTRHGLGRMLARVLLHSI